MAQQRLLFISANRLTAWYWRGGELRAEGEFAPDDEGLRAFAAYLQRNQSSVFAAVADVAEEGFQSESIPRVQGADRKAVIKRKLSQLFYGTPLSVAISQGRERTGRRDERILFVALTRPQQFEFWLAALRQADSQLMSLHNLPIVVAELLGKTAASLPQLLVVALTHAGLRQTFFQNGELRFSRLTPMQAGGIGEAAAAAAVESVKIYQYLAGQRLITRGSTLPTLLLAHPADMARFREHCVDTDELRFSYIDLLARAKEVGLKNLPTDTYSERLFLHLLAKRTPAHQLLPSAELRHYRLWQFRVALNGAGVVVLFGCMLFAAKGAYEFYSRTESAAELRAHTDSERQRYAAIMSTLPPTPLSADNLRAAVGRFETLQKRSPALEASYLAISRALEESPRVELSRINWFLSANPDAGLEEGTRSGNAGTALQMAPTAADGAFFAIADIQGVLPMAMANDNRALLDTVNAFAASLRNDNRLLVRVTRIPFDTESGKTLKSDAEPAASVSAPSFSLRILQRL